MAESVSVVIVSFRDEPLLAACLAGLARCLATSEGGVIREIILVDNGAGLTLGFAMPDEVRILAVAPAIPYASAINRGMVACSPDSQFIWVLDSDQVPEAGILSELLRCLKLDPQLAAIGPRQISPQGRALASYGYFPQSLTQVWELVPLRFRTRIDRYLRGPRDIAFVDYIPMGGMLMRREALPTGLRVLDERWAWGNHDLDLCYRWYRADWKVGVTDAASLVHDIDSPLKPNIGDRFAIGQISLARWVVTQHAGQPPVSIRILFAVRLLVQALAFFVVGRKRESASRLQALRESWHWLTIRRHAR